MALPQAFSSTATLQGAREVNYTHLAFAQGDVGGKLQALISTVTALASNLLIIQSAVLSANVSAVTFSSLSGVTFTVTTAISNFRS